MNVRHLSTACVAALALATSSCEPDTTVQELMGHATIDMTTRH